jgi:hypothetical protein
MTLSDSWRLRLLRADATKEPVTPMNPKIAIEILKEGKRMMFLGNEEVLLIQLPRGTHAVAERLKIDLGKLALAAVIDRVRAGSLADHMMEVSRHDREITHAGSHPPGVREIRVSVLH